uniref:Integrase catalytic domain-containing protein n=1 Tax=Trichogramma kaykai TaxID=54128 RepID=A0ABD2VXG0_9HYME
MDQGAQFEKDLFQHVCRAFRIERIRTTPYHPASNGMVERFHRDLKNALRYRQSSGEWLDTLPSVLLGLRTCPILDTDLSPAEMLYGNVLKIPGIFC